VSITTFQPDTKSNNPNPNPNPNPTTKQHAIVNIQLNTVTCSTYSAKSIRHNVVVPSVLVSIVICVSPTRCRVHTLRAAPRMKREKKTAARRRIATSDTRGLHGRDGIDIRQSILGLCRSSVATRSSSSVTQRVRHMHVACAYV